MAKDRSVPGYKISVTGEYFSKDVNTGLKGIKTFEAIEFELPEIVTYVEGREKVEKVINGRAVSSTRPCVKEGHATRVGLHIIRRYLLESVLKEKFPEFTGIRKCAIFKKIKTNIKPQKKLSASNIQDMKESELKQFVMLNDINIVLSAYGDLGDQKNAVQAAFNQKKKDDVAAGLTESMSKEAAALLPTDGIETYEPDTILGDLG